MPNDADDIERHSEQHQGQQGAKSGRGQRRDDRERMDHALVKNAKNDVDGDQGSDDQNGRAAERALESLGVTLEAGGDRRRQVEIGGGFADRSHRISNRAVGREVEAQRDRGELALVVLILSRRRSRHHHPFLGELAGIAQQVEQNLLQPHEGPRGQGAPRLSRASTPRAGSCSTVSWCAASMTFREYVPRWPLQRE